MQEHKFNIKELSPNIFQIEDYRQVYCTLVKGSKLVLV